MTGLSKQNRLVHTNIMNAATFPSPSASTASASTIMSRASEDILSQRKILKAARSPPLKTGISRASEDIIKQRKIVKVNKSWLGSPSPSCSSPAPCSTVHESAGKAIIQSTPYSRSYYTFDTTTHTNKFQR